MELIYRKYRLLLIFAFFFIAVSVAIPKIWLGHEDSSIQPLDAVLTVTMLYVPEIEACKPDGYQSYSSNEPSNCIKLAIKDIDDWIDRGCRKIDFTIPPSEISLGEEFLELLDSYENFSKDDPVRRRSIVLMFDWKEPQNLSISLKRENLSETDKGVRNMLWRGSLSNERRWIHHERADSFLPANNIKWTLIAGENKWIFKTKR